MENQEDSKWRGGRPAQGGREPSGGGVGQGKGGAQQALLEVVEAQAKAIGRLRGELSNLHQEQAGQGGGQSAKAVKNKSGPRRGSFVGATSAPPPSCGPTGPAAPTLHSAARADSGPPRGHSRGDTRRKTACNAAPAQPPSSKRPHLDRLQQLLRLADGEPVIRVKGSLRRNVGFWERLAPQPWILNVIRNGYALPIRSYVNVPLHCATKYQLSLLRTGAVVQVHNRPHVTSPFSVASNSAKLRLILDLSWFNKYLGTTSIKYEGLECISDLLPKGGYLGKFDMKSGYHHVDILPSHCTYLGFSWNFGDGDIFFTFTVLPFGLSCAPFLFTKLFRPLVQSWRCKGILCALYIDDGLEPPRWRGPENVR